MVEELIDSLESYLAGNAVIKAYCQTKYTKDQTVVIGQSENTPVQTDAMPAIIIGSPTVVYNNEIRIYKFPIAVAIGNNAFAGGVYLGAKQISGLAELIAEQLILAPHKSQVSVDSVPPASAFPVWHALLTCTIEKKKPIRPVRA